MTRGRRSSDASASREGPQSPQPIHQNPTSRADLFPESQLQDEPSAPPSAKRSFRRWKSRWLFRGPLSFAGRLPHACSDAATSWCDGFRRRVDCIWQLSRAIHLLGVLSQEQMCHSARASGQGTSLNIVIHRKAPASCIGAECAQMATSMGLRSCCHAVEEAASCHCVQDKGGAHHFSICHMYDL